MLTHLSIRNIALIESLDLEFESGLCVITGETGAGKSILLDALGLVLGDRADGSLLRKSAARGSVTASFEFPQFPDSGTKILTNAGIEFSKNEPFVVRRQLKADGASKSFINDQPASVALLRQIAGVFIEIHGQHDDRGLANSSGHRVLLDRYAKVEPEELAQAWHRLTESKKRLDLAKVQIENARREEDLLKAHYEELKAFSPLEDEETGLVDLRASLQKGEKLTGDLDELRQVWEGPNSPLEVLRAAARKLERINTHDELLADALAALDRAMVEAEEAETKISCVADGLVFDPIALDEAETRLFSLRNLARKHSCTPAELPQRMSELYDTLAAIQDSETELRRLEIELDEANKKYTQVAHEVHKVRVNAAARLDEAVSKELPALKLENARFNTSLVKVPETRWGSNGIDQVEFMVATNHNSDFGPINKIASGGELSRFILSLKVSLADKGRATTVIFDEIDRGVGGAVASAIGERLARLAKGGQVVVVTHSPQVAARGDVHYLIEKSSSGVITKTSVSKLDVLQRQNEIARMLSGEKITVEAKAQAERLLESA